MGHPECGQVVHVVRQSVHNGKPCLSIELPDGRREQILRAWTEDLNDGGSAVPALLFSPSSLRALVRLVREHGRAPSAETSHALLHSQDLEAPAPGNACRDDAALGRADAPPDGARPDRRRDAQP